MNRYWDLDRQGRAEFTEEQVRAFLEVELMEKGVRNVEPLVLKDVPEIELPKGEFFTIEHDGKYSGKETLDVVFKDTDAAATFIALKPLGHNYDYEVGTDYRYAKPLTGLAILPISLCAEVDILNEKSKLAERKATKEANSTAENDYTVACRAVRDATKEVWDDWNECQAWQRKTTRALALFEEYKEHTKDEAQALFFLLKVEDEDVVTDALGNEKMARLSENMADDEDEGEA